MAFDVAGARKAGYSDAEIAEHLASTSQFDAKAARKAGYTDTELIAHLLNKPQSAADRIPGQPADVVAPAATAPVATAPTTMVDKAIGTGEAALTAVTGATGGALGLAGGTIQGLAGAVMKGDFGTPQAANRIEQAAADGAQALTYQPRTQSGQEQATVFGELMAQAIPAMPLTAELGAAARGAAPVARAAQDATRAGVKAVAEAAPKTSEALKGALAGSSTRVREALGVGDNQPTAGTQGSVGAAGTDAAFQRRQTAENLPVPIKLTEGQATREQSQVMFERETAKQEVGGGLRDRYAEQNERLPQNFEAAIDATGAEKGGVAIEVGRSVDEALRGAAAKAKAEYRVKYRAAEQAGQMAEPVSLQPLADYLNQNRAGRTSAPILATIADELSVKDVGKGSLADGTVAAGDATLAQVEAIRKAVNRFVKDTDPNDMRVGIEIKQVIDGITEGKGGDVYQQARKARQRYSQLFEDNAIVSDLLKTKRGTADRQVALENVVRRTVLNGTRDDLSMLRRTLHNDSAGPSGKQAWAELQGATIRHMLEESTRGAATDVRGNVIFSAAKLNDVVRNLERGGKLDFILSKKGAQHIRDLNDLAKVIYTSPPGSVNTSNTAGVIMAAIAEAGITGSMIGLPLPVASGVRLLASHVRDRKLRVRINAALGNGPKPKPLRAPPIPPAPQPRTLQ